MSNGVDFVKENCSKTSPIFKMYFKIVLVTFLLVTVPHVLRILHFLGFHVVVFNHAPGPCKLVQGVDFGSEDMETLPNGLTFITSGFTWPLASSKFREHYTMNNIKGKILLYNFKYPDKGVTELGFSDDFDSSTFAPHGLSVIQNEDTGTITVFVVNHKPNYDSIEKFEFVEEMMLLDHIHSYKSQEVHIVNDVAAVNENSFYFTNYAYSREHFSFLLELMLLLPWGNIMFYDGASYKTVQDSLVIPNGILLSKDQRAVYMSHGAFNTINLFRREEDDTLTLTQEYQLHTGPDNILLEPGTGNLVIGTHPSVTQISKHMEDYNLPAPSKVVLVHMKNDTFADHTTELYSDDGHTLFGSSVASIYDGKMLIGTVMHKLLVCELKSLQ